MGRNQWLRDGIWTCVPSNLFIVVEYVWSSLLSAITGHLDFQHGHFRIFLITNTCAPTYALISTQMFLLRQTFPLCCLLKCRKFWHVWFCYIDCVCVCVCVKVAQSCPTLCEPLDCSVPGSSAHGIPQARKNTRVASCSLLQRISPTQGSNPGLPHWRWIL